MRITSSDQGRQGMKREEVWILTVKSSILLTYASLRKRVLLEASYYSGNLLGDSRSLCTEWVLQFKVQSVQARIDSVTPYSGQLDLWPSCQSPYSRQNGGKAGGCGGGDGQSIGLHAPFQPSDGAGTTVTAQQLNVNPAGPDSPFGVKMPATLDAHWVKHWEYSHVRTERARGSARVNATVTAL